MSIRVVAISGLQWGPVVVTGIRGCSEVRGRCTIWKLQWGPVVVTGISNLRAVEVQTWSELQWGPVVVTGIRARGWGGL